MAFRSAQGAASTYPSNSLTITAPSGITDGDILVACVWAWNDGGTPPEGTFSLPSGFTAWYSPSVGSYKGVLAWKRASSESGNYAFSITGAEFVFGQMVAFSGRIASGDPLDVGSNTGYTTSNTTVRAAGVTIATTGSDLIYAGFAETDGSASLTEPSGMTSRRSDDWTGDLTAMETASLDNQSTGATGDKDGTANASTTWKHAFLIALKPAVGSGSLGANFAFADMPLSPYLATPRVSGVHDLPPAVVSRQFVPGCSVPGETVLRRDLVTMTFGCVAWAEDHTSLVANLRTIKGLVSPEKGWAPLWVVDRPTQRTMALSRGFPLRANAIPYCTTVVEFDLSFDRLPWWEDLSAQSATIDEADTTGTITNDGDLSCWPVYTCTVGAGALAGGLTFTVNGKTYTYKDALDAADVLVVNTEACTTERNGTADMAGTTDDCEYPELVTGANAVTAKTAGFTLVASYRRRYE